MLLSRKWLDEFVHVDANDKDFAEAMTLSGSKVETTEDRGAEISNIVVGTILTMERHPDSDHMWICQLDVGQSAPIQIVTGAWNIHPGDMVPVALDHSTLPGGKKIEKGKLRGVESNGMMCSIEELGSNRDMYPEAPEYGIYIFPENAVVGESAIKALGLDDVVFEYEITSNRVDCYGVLGIAREAAATFGKKFYPPEVKETGNDEKASDYVKVTVEKPELCPRYCARVVKNVKIGPSPKWMQRCLASNGIRPINNLVDITNYVMEEFGQPMHAYDLDTIANHEIVVRCAGKDEKFVTLDGQERIMDENVLMICDGEKPVGIAGIMGGENSMITDDVHTVLFEAACFDGTNIRLSSKRIGLRTDASGKFEKGLDPNNAKAAIDRACQLMEELGAGEVVGGMVDICNKVSKPSRVKFEPDRINGLLGTNLSKEEMLGYLAKIELTYDEETNEIVAPTFRQDIHCMADVAEEIARFYGYDKIPTTLPSGEATTGKMPFKLRIENIARDIAEYCGFSEGMTYSFESPKVFDKLRIPEDNVLRQVITISNPLGEDYSIMRTSTLNGMLSSLATNYNRRNNVYLPKALPLTELPDERTMFTLGMYGTGDFFDMKGVCEEFFEKIGMKKKMEYDPASGKPFLHPGRQADMVYEGTVVGYLGEVHPLVADNYGIGERAYIAMIDIKSVLEFANFDRKFTGIAKYPAVTRDISMLVPKQVLAGQIEDILAQRGGKILESYQLFDIYEGSQIKGGYKSMAYALVFRDHDKTLEESEISAAMKKIVNGLEGLGIELRS